MTSIRGRLSVLARYAAAPVLGSAVAMALPPHFWLLLLVPGFSGLLWILERALSKGQGFAIGWLFEDWIASVIQGADLLRSNISTSREFARRARCMAAQRHE